MIAITIAIGNMTQYGIMGNIEDLDKKNFIKTNAPFNIKNEGAEPVTVEVNLWDMPRDNSSKQPY